MTQRFDVAVVGAGVIGLAVALEVRRTLGVSVVVLERGASPCIGSTARANGGVRAQFSTAINIQMSQHTIARLAELDRASGGLVAYRPVGYLFLAGDERIATRLRDAMSVQRALGVPVAEVARTDIEGRAPFVRVDGIHFAAFCAADGLVDPHGVGTALWNAGREAGVEYRFGAAVRALQRDRDLTVLSAADLSIQASTVVNAAGPSAASVAQLAGVELPVTPYRRNLVCTEPVAGIPAAAPMCVDADTGLLVRREGAGVVIAHSNPRDAPSSEETFDPQFIDVIAQLLPHRFPSLLDAAVNPRKCWAGLYPETPDHHSIIDAPAGAPWFIQCAGFGGHGIMHSLAAGLCVAELIRDGACASFDIAPLRLARFQERSGIVETAVL